jgi:hypothetical protein
MSIKTFKDFLKSKTLTFIDIDETLFKTFAKVSVVKNGKVVRKLDNVEFNTYVLQPGESFDFGEFGNSKLFKSTSIPIKKTIKVLRTIYKHSIKTDGDVYLLTARADFDDKEGFISTLRSYGIPAGNKKDGLIHVLRAGNMPGSGSAERKKAIINNKILDKNYKNVTIFDDDVSNIAAFLSLSKKFTDVTFFAFLVKDGRISLYDKKNAK